MPAEIDGELISPAAHALEAKGITCWWAMTGFFLHATRGNARVLAPILAINNHTTNLTFEINKNYIDI